MSTVHNSYFTKRQKDHDVNVDADSHGGGDENDAVIINDDDDDDERDDWGFPKQVLECT